jgi:hypothetical protein
MSSVDLPACSDARSVVRAVEPRLATWLLSQGHTADLDMARMGVMELSAIAAVEPSAVDAARVEREIASATKDLMDVAWRAGHDSVVSQLDRFGPDHVDKVPDTAVAWRRLLYGILGPMVPALRRREAIRRNMQQCDRLTAAITGITSEVRADTQVLLADLGITQRSALGGSLRSAYVDGTRACIAELQRDVVDEWVELVDLAIGDLDRHRSLRGEPITAESRDAILRRLSELDSGARQADLRVSLATVEEIGSTAAAAEREVRRSTLAGDLLRERVAVCRDEVARQGVALPAVSLPTTSPFDHHTSARTRAHPDMGLRKGRQASLPSSLHADVPATGWSDGLVVRGQARTHSVETLALTAGLQAKAHEVAAANDGLAAIDCRLVDALAGVQAVDSRFAMLMAMPVEAPRADCARDVVVVVDTAYPSGGIEF